MPEVMTIRKCLKYMKELHPRTAVTEHLIRELVRQRLVEFFMVGTKHMIYWDSLMEWLGRPQKNFLPKITNLEEYALVLGWAEKFINPVDENEIYIEKGELQK